jgi:arabinofuranosyltransferase
VGGDFMAGRMLTAPLLCGAVLLARAEWLRGPSGALGASVVLIGVGFAAPNPSFLSGIRESFRYAALVEPTGIADERRLYDPITGLRNYARHGGVPAHEWEREGAKARRDQIRVALMVNIGFYGFAAGPDVHVVDPHGLSEPFLARLPPAYRPDWRIGHVRRELPEGYWETLLAGVDRIADPGLARYRAKLELITRGPIWSAERWDAILGMALGRYEPSIDVQRYRFPPAARLPQASVAEPPRPGTRGGASGTTILAGSGADVVLSEPSHAGRVELSLGGDDACALVYFRGERDLAISKLTAAPRAGPGLRVIRADVPSQASEAGFDRVRVIPYGGDGRYAIGHLRPR